LRTEAQQLLLKYLSSQRKEEGFTLVELIVVVVIIGILSSIAIPSFQNASDKAKQKEATTLVSSYLKAAQAHQLEYGVYANYTRDLGKYISIAGCRRNLPSYCKSASPVIYTNSMVTKWYSQSGFYELEITGYPRWVIFARPTGQYSATGRGVVGCLNYQTGATKILEMSSPAPQLPRINC
tara:strand:+ start:2129 stop:2671 length:543 start_codon:yes stop_codon:yes gene_type:complete